MSLITGRSAGGLRALITDRLAPTATFRTFAIPGESHTLLGAVDTTTSGGVALEAWLTAMLSGDPGWAVKPAVATS